MSGSRTPEQIAQKERYISKILCGAIQAAILFYPIFMLSNVVSWNHHDAAAFLIITIAALLYGLALFGDSAKQALLKWACSIPVTVMLWYYFASTHFYLRALNQEIPGYGNQAAGGSFATAVLMAFQLILCFFTGLTAILCSSLVRESRPWRLILLIRTLILLAICAAIVITIIWYTAKLPSYNSIFFAG